MKYTYYVVVNDYGEYITKLSGTLMDWGFRSDVIHPKHSGLFTDEWAANFIVDRFGGKVKRVTITVEED